MQHLPAEWNAEALARAPRAGRMPSAAGEPPGERSDAGAAAPVERRTFDRVRWTFRGDFGSVLARLPAAAWADPAGQGWQRVKHNAARTVWRASIAESVYYVKYYACRGWRDALKRTLRGSACESEWNSGIYAAKAGISAVRPVGCARRVRLADGFCSILVTAAVEPAYPLHEFWATLRSDDNLARRRQDTAGLIDTLAEMIARAHQSGFEHRDLHAANILVHPVAPGTYETVFVDVQNARLGAPLGDRAVVRNLAQLNQWFRRHSSIGDRLRFLRRYLRWRDEYEQAFAHARPLDMTFDRLVRALVTEAERHAARLWAKRDRRARRSNRYFARIRVGGGWRGMAFLSCKQPVEESPASSLTFSADWWQQQLRNPLRSFVPQAAQSCKESHSALVSRDALDVQDQKLPIIVKRPLARNWRRRLRQLVGPSRSLRGWRVGYALLNRDIPTARPLAALERRRGPLVLDDVLLTETIPGALDLEAYLRREFEARSRRDWCRHERALSDLLVSRIRQLAERGFVHRDCKAQNVLVVTQPRLNLIWIDMDGLRRVARCSMSQQLRMLTRLHVSLSDVPGLTRTDRLRFLKAYLARFGSDRQAWRQAWRRIARASARKLRAQQVRRRWKLDHYGRP